MAYKKKNKVNIFDYLINFTSIVVVIGVISFVILKVFTAEPKLPQKTTEATTSNQLQQTTEPTTSDLDIDYVDPERPSGELSIPDNVYFSTEAVNVRAKASTASEAYSIIYKYQWVEVVAIEGKWSKIVYEDSPTGYAYMYSKYLSNEAEFINEAITYHQELADDAVVCSNIVDTSKVLYTYEEMISDLNELSAKYPDKLAVSTIGTTIDGRDIYLAVLGNPAAEKQIIVHANIHAREHMNVMLTMKQIEYYLDNYNYWYDSTSRTTYKDLFDNVCIYYIPTLNPDGMALSQFGIEAIRSESIRNNLLTMSGSNDFSTWKANANGIDLNKQFPYGFKNDIMALGPSSENYAGEEALSENEAKALYDLVHTMSNPVCAIAYHSKGEDVFWDTNAGEEFDTYCKEIATVIADETGYDMNHSFNKYNGYDQDWFVMIEKIPSITVETGTGECPLPHYQFYNLWKDNKKLIAKLAEYFINK